MAHQYRLLLFLFFFFLFTTTNNTNALNDDLSSLNSFCDSTPYPHSCFRSLMKPPFGSENILSHLRTTLAAAISESLDLSSLLSRDLAIVENQRGALQDCRELHEVTVNALRRSAKKVNAGDIAGAGAYLSAAMANERTCLEGLESASGPMKATVVRSVAGAYGHVGNALWMVSKIGAPAKRDRNRRLAAKRGWKRRLRAKRDSSYCVVSQDGTENFTTISEAVSFAPSNSQYQFMIVVCEGIYRENVVIPAHKTNILFFGSGSEVTIVTGSRSVAAGWTAFRSATFAVSGNGFTANDMGFENTAGPEGGGAVALLINADFVALWNCDVIGYQNTLYAHSFRQFYQQCNISGTIDYIFGDAAAVFQESKIISKLPSKGQRYTVVTAQTRAFPYSSTGFSFQRCYILPTEELCSNRATVRNYLGRPAKAYSRTVVLKSYIDDFIDPSGWMEFSGREGLETLYFGEYDNLGPGSGTEKRVRWGGYHPVMNSSDVYYFTLSKFIAGNLWLDATEFPYANMQIGCVLE